MAVTNQGRGLVMKLSIIDSKPGAFLISAFGMSCTGMKCASFAKARKLIVKAMYHSREDGRDKSRKRACHETINN
jgi:hypothetical protein